MTFDEANNLLKVKLSIDNLNNFGIITELGICRKCDHLKNCVAFKVLKNSPIKNCNYFQITKE